MVKTLKRLKYNREIPAARKLKRHSKNRKDYTNSFLDMVPYPIVVYSKDGLVLYLNSAFTNIFGWTLEELSGKTIPYVPPGYDKENHNQIQKLITEDGLSQYETKRLTKDGRTLNIAQKVMVYPQTYNQLAEKLIIMRDITDENRIRRNNDAMLRISTALPEYHYVDSLLDYITSEVKQLLNTEGALVILMDEKKNELYFPAASYDDIATLEKVKEIRFSIDEILAGKVIKTGEPVIINDTSKEPVIFPERDIKFGYHTRNLIEVPLREKGKITGVLCAINKKQGTFGQSDVELLNMVAGTISLTIENARFSEELKKAYKEVSSLNKAKDKAIIHLSHELRTPLQILTQAIDLLELEFSSFPDDHWKSFIQKAKKSMARLVEIQVEVEDIMDDTQHRAFGLISLLFDQCVDIIELLITKEYGRDNIIESIKKRIMEIFGPKENISNNIFLDQFVRERIEKIKELSSHRSVEIESQFEEVPSILIPKDTIQKVVDGLIKNAIENTPDEGKIEIYVKQKGNGITLEIKDYGVGIIEDYQQRIFEGFFTTRDIFTYSTRNPFDFNAGGKGSNLLRMKIFSERYNFNIDLESSRCRFIPNESDVCPGIISKCENCSNTEDCYNESGTTFSLFFPTVTE